MPPDPIVYCLEQLTDYAGFERVCHELLRYDGYTGLEPLGGFKDKGRDAVHVSRTDAAVTSVFAYSVREDWRPKLDEDAAKIQKHGHQCDQLVFLTTSAPSASERDQAITDIETTYGWKLEIHGLERLRTLLATNGRSVIPGHPEIFPPAFFAAAVPDIPKDAVDCLVIDSAPDDDAFALWLSRRLLVEGYRVWCTKLAFTGGEAKEVVLERVIQDHGFRLLSVCSRSSATSPDLASRRGMALVLGRARNRDMVIPVILDAFDHSVLDAGTRGLAGVDFAHGWAAGLAQLLTALHRAGCQRPLLDGKSVALRSCVPNSALVKRPETLYSNCFPVLQIPKVVRSFITDRELGRTEIDSLRQRWAFSAPTGNAFFSFHDPPDEDRAAFGFRNNGGAAWRDVSKIRESRATDVITELIRREIDALAVERGLVRCKTTDLIYFPPELKPDERLSFRQPDGTWSWVAPTGRRKFWRPNNSSYYRYALAAAVEVRRDLGREYVALLRIRLRITDDDGAPLPPRTALSRRKHLCGDWWNGAWFNRTLAVFQFLADGAAEITRGHLEDPLRIAAEPRHWNVAWGIAEEALNTQLLDRSELQPSDDDDEEEVENVDQVVVHE